MHAPLVTLAFLTTSTLALQGMLNSPHSFGAMLKRGEAIAKRQQGYYPTSDPCSGTGTTCAQVCGADTVECPSNDNTILSCHSKNDGSHCCTDGTGNACGPGDYCTHDSVGQTYCCPGNLNAEECAKAIGVNVSLIPEASSSAVAPAPASASAPAHSSAVATPKTATPSGSATKTPSPSAAHASSSSSSKATGTQAPVVPVLPSGSHASGASSTKTPSASTTGSSTPQFTGGAARVAEAGAAMVAAVAGFVML